MKANIDLGFLNAQEFVARRSKTLIDDPGARLDELVEVSRYLSTLEPSYRQEIQQLSRCDTQPLPAKVRAIVTIIAYREGTRIADTLDCYLNQDLGSDEYEIIIFDNHPIDEVRDDTVDKVEQFRKRHPNVSVIYAYKTWQESDRKTIGVARKYVFDIALMRINKRGNVHHDTVLVSNDADTIGFDPNYLSAISAEFDKHALVDALVTLNAVPKSAFEKPNIFAILGFWDALDNVVATGEPYNLIGNTSAYRASMYAAIGGYNPEGKLAGDLETGFMIADARGWDPRSVIQLTKTRHIQDPRRILEAVASRVPVNEMYYKFVSAPEVREADNAALLRLIPDELDWDLLEEDLDSFRAGSKTGMYKWRGSRFEGDYANAMDRIGVTYTVENDRLKFLSVDRLLAGYKAEFGRDVKIIRSDQRVLDLPKLVEMGQFFSTVADSAIECRRIMAEQIAAKIQLARTAASSAQMDELLSQYERFAGTPYSQTSR